MDNESKQHHEANRRGWDAASPRWQARVDEAGIWPRCPTEPELVLAPQELAYLSAIDGKQVAVLGSGDNKVVFALAGLGAQVTSVDFSQTQLDIGAERARRLGLDVTFVQADVTDLEGLPDGAFDLVYTGGHVGVWVADLKAYYWEAGRILRPEGLLMVSEYHPFRRIWRFDTDRLEVITSYFDRGPMQYDRADEVEGAAAGSLPSFEYNWTVADYVTALLEAGVRLIAMEEWGDQVEWEDAPLTGLPATMLMVGRKQ